MTREQLSAFYAHYVAAANARDYEAIAGLIHDAVAINGVPRTREDVLASLAGFADIVPDFTWTIEELLIDGDRIAARLHDTGTPAKPWLGVDPTGAAIEITEFAIYRVRDGRFAEMWFLMDTASAAEQLTPQR